MKLLTLGAGVLMALPAAAQVGLHVADPLPLDVRGPRTGKAQVGCSYLEVAAGTAMHVRMTGGTGSMFMTFFQSGWTGTFLPGQATFLATGTLDASGGGMAKASFASLYNLPVNFSAELYGVYFDEAGVVVTPADAMIFNPLPLAALDFDRSAEGDLMPAGTQVEEAWTAAGLHVQAENPVPGHPDAAVLFDSSAPTGGDTDLVTPGYGLGNDVAYGNLLIVPENAAFPFEPDDEAGGGTLTFRFDQPTMLSEIVLIDQDETETVQLIGRLGSEVVIDDLWDGLGDNSRMEIAFGTELVTELAVRMSGSGAVAELKAMPCPTRVDFDVATYGAAAGVAVGEPVTGQFEASLGMRVSAQSQPGGTDLAAIFDTASPTGDDTDLATPGYHPTNQVSLKRVLILAENAIDADHDGMIDVPDDDLKGGRLVFDFGYDVVFEAATVIDVDLDEVSWFEAFDRNGDLIQEVSLRSLGDNSVQTVTPLIPGVRTIVLVLGGSGALADLSFCHDMGAF